MLYRKGEKGKREEREEEADLISAPSDQRQSSDRKLFVVDTLVWSMSFYRSRVHLVCYFVQALLHLKTHARPFISYMPGKHCSVKSYEVAVLRKSNQEMEYG